MSGSRDVSDSESWWPSDISKREVLVCNLICRSEEPVGFGHLKRTTGLHQEILSRVLKRLRIRGLISLSGLKYVECCSGRTDGD